MLMLTVCGVVFPISTDMDSSVEIKYYHWDVCDISTRCLYGIRLRLSELSFMWEENWRFREFLKNYTETEHTFKEHKLKLITFNVRMGRGENRCERVEGGFVKTFLSRLELFLKRFISVIAIPSNKLVESHRRRRW